MHESPVTQDDVRPLSATRLQAAWRGFRERDCGPSVWLRYERLDRRNAAARVLQEAFLHALDRRQEHEYQREEDIDRAMRALERVLIAHLRSKAAKRAFRLRKQHKAAMRIQRIQRGIKERRALREKRVALAQASAAITIQRFMIKYHERGREARLRALAALFKSCARCGAIDPTEFVFDLQQVLCIKCVATASASLAVRGHVLRPRGLFLGAVINLGDKRKFDDVAAKIQRMWRRVACAALARKGTCSMCSRAATHIDHALQHYLCRRCAELAASIYHLKPWDRRLQTFAQFEHDQAAADVIHRFWHRARRVLRRRTEEAAYCIRATKAARCIGRVMRGALVRHALVACEAAHVLLYSGLFKTVLRRQPGLWFVGLHNAILGVMVPLLVGDRVWRTLGAPVHYKRRYIVRDVLDSAKLLINRLVRGLAARRRVRRVREEVERERTACAHRLRVRQIAAAWSIQRIVRGFVARSATSRRRIRRLAAVGVSQIACDPRARASDAAQIWHAHGGFLGRANLQPAQLLGASFGLSPDQLILLDSRHSPPAAGGAATVRVRLMKREARNNEPLANLLVGGFLILRLAISPAQQKATSSLHFCRPNDIDEWVRAIKPPPRWQEMLGQSNRDSTRRAQKQKDDDASLLSSDLWNTVNTPHQHFPLVLVLHIVRATLASLPGPPAGNDDCLSISVRWCGKYLGESRAADHAQVGAPPFVERQKTFYLTCDAERCPHYFGSRAPAGHLLTLSSYSAGTTLTAKFDARDLLPLLGTRTTLELRKGSSNDAGGAVTILLAAEPLAQTEARRIVSSVVECVIENILHVIPSLAPHVKCALLSYKPLHRSQHDWRHPCQICGGSVRAILTWNDRRAGETPVRVDTGLKSVLRRKRRGDLWEFVLPVEIAPRDEAGHDDSLTPIKPHRIDLMIELVPAFGGRPWGRAHLNEDDFECEDYREILADVFAIQDVEKSARQLLVGNLRIDTALFRLPIPFWRRRRDAVEMYVANVIAAALRRVPQPRVVLTLLDVSGLPVNISRQSLECRVLWGDVLHTIYYASRNDIPQSREENHQWIDANKSVSLFLPAHGLSIPDLKFQVVVGYTRGSDSVISAKENKAACLGEAYVRGPDLVTFCGRVDLDIFEASTTRSFKNPSIHRIVPGKVIIFVDVVDIPDYLLRKRPKDDFPAVVDVVNDDDEPELADEEAVVELTDVTPAATMQLALIDLAITDNMNTAASIERDNVAIERLLAHGNPYAVVRWQGMEVGCEEVVRQSLLPLVVGPGFHHAHVAAVASKLPRQPCLEFSGRPYLFPLAPQCDDPMMPATKVDVKIEVYSIGGVGQGQTQDRFLGQATLEQEALKDMPITYRKLPLLRRKRDTLNHAFVKFELKQFAGYEIRLDSLKAADVASSGVDALLLRSKTKLRMQLQLIRSNSHKERAIDSTESSVLLASDSHNRWSSVESVVLNFLPETSQTNNIAMDDDETILHVALWRTQAPACEIGQARYALKSLLDAHRLDTDTPAAETITLRLISAQQEPRGYASLRVLVRDAGSSAVARSKAFKNEPRCSMATSDDVDLPRDDDDEEDSANRGIILTAQWTNEGGDVLRSAATLRIYNPGLLRESLKLIVSNKKGPDRETTVGEGFCDLSKLVTEKSSECSCSVRLNPDNPDEHKVLDFVAWLEKTQYFSLNLYRVRVTGMSTSKTEVYVTFRLGQSEVATQSLKSVAPLWNEHTPLRLPATFLLMKHHQLRIELWIRRDAHPSTMLATASALVDELIVAWRAKAPMRLTMPFVPKTRREECRGFVSLTITCDEIPSRSDMDFLAAADALEAVSSTLTPTAPEKSPQVIVQLVALEAHGLPKTDVWAVQAYCQARIGVCVARTTATIGMESSCSWTKEVLTIDTDLDTVTGSILEFEVHQENAGSFDELLGTAYLHLSPTRFLTLCGDSFRSSLGRKDKVSRHSTNNNPKTRIAVKLKRPGHEACGVLVFEIRVLMETVEGIEPPQAWRKEQMVASTPGQHQKRSQDKSTRRSNDKRPKGRTGRRMSLDRYFENLNAQHVFFEAAAVEGTTVFESMTVREKRSAPMESPSVLATQQNDDMSGKTPIIGENCSRVWIGGVLRLHNVMTTDDEIELASNPDEAVETINDANKSEAEFLIGSYDDVAEAAKARRQCRQHVPRDRNELRVCVLRARGLRSSRRLYLTAAFAKQDPIPDHVEDSNAADPVVTLRIVVGEDGGDVQSTSNARQTLNPEWHERFVLTAYEPLPEDDKEPPPSLEVLVKNHDATTSSDFMGTVKRLNQYDISLAGAGLIPLAGPDSPPGLKEGTVVRRWVCLRERSQHSKHASILMKDEPMPTGMWGA